MRPVSKRVKGFLTSALAGFFLLLCLMAASNAVFDPLHIVRPPQTQDVYDRQTRFALPGLLRQNASPFAIVGTSVVQDFDEAYFRQVWGEPVTRYPLLGGTGYEQRRLLETLLTAPVPPQTVIWGLDVGSFVGPLDRIRWDQFPEHLFRNDWTVYPAYIFSFQTFYRLLRLIPDRGKVYTPQTRFYFEAPDLEFSRNAVLKSYCGEGLARRISTFRDFDFSTQQDHIARNILPILRQNPEVRFILFFPPYSAVQYAEFERAGVLGHVLSFRENVLRAVDGLKTVRLYDFQADARITENLDDYRDPFHYGQNTMHILTQELRRHEHILTPQNLEARQDSIKRQAADYKGIWDEVADFCSKN